MTKDYFAYGTFMCEDILLAVTGHRFNRTPGFLRDYRRRAVKGEVYPGILPERDGVVEGIVYRDLPDTAWARLDAFEGEMYQRQIVSVNLADDTPRGVHLCRQAGFLRMARHGANADLKILQSGKKTFETHYFGFKARK